MNSRFQKKSLLVISILFGGLVPILVYFVLHGGLGVSSIEKLQSVTYSEQLALMLSLFYLKPAYLLLAVGLIITFWERATQPAFSLFWGFVALLTGELICGTTFAAFQRELIISEHIHSYGMMLEFIFITFALLEFLDRRVPQHPNRIHSTFALIAATGMIASFLPLSVSTTQSGYSADLFGFPYTYIRFAFNQWVESRALPVASLCFFSLALFTSLKSKLPGLRVSAKIFFSAGVGLLGFSIFRLTLGALFEEKLVWFEFWEETTQFILVSTIAVMLWQHKREWVFERFDMFRSAQ